MKSIKPGVSLYGIKPEMVIVDSVVTSVFLKFGYDCVTTSGVGMKHSTRSLHYPGYAEDYRSKHISDIKIKHDILNHLRECLPCCDIVLEHIGEPEEHYHVEFDPKDDDNFQSDKIFYKTHGNWPKR
jgi:hypothetical protein